MSPILYIFLCLFEFLCQSSSLSILHTKTKRKWGGLCLQNVLFKIYVDLKFSFFTAENQAQTQKMVRKIIHGTIICMGNIKIPLLDTLRITKSLVRKIYLSGAWEPPLPTLLIPPYPKEWTKITCAQEEHILNLPASLEYLR